VVFRIDAQSGKLNPTGEKQELPSPVCIRMVASG
jgi:6-phosphogluconolactonase (cycloisomerase 2 family)